MKLLTLILAVSSYITAQQLDMSHRPAGQMPSMPSGMIMLMLGGTDLQRNPSYANRYSVAADVYRQCGGSIALVCESDFLQRKLEPLPCES